jgi:hypothetical protein
VAKGLRKRSASKASPPRATPPPATVGSVNISAFAEAAMAPVTFTCSSPNCVVGLTAAHASAVLRGTQPETILLPMGTFSLFYRVQGAGAFAVAVAGGQLSAPIAGAAPDGGVRVIQVP